MPSKVILCSHSTALRDLQLNSCRLHLHHSLTSSHHSLCGLRLLLEPSINTIRNLIFLLHYLSSAYMPKERISSVTPKKSLVTPFASEIPLGDYLVYSFSLLTILIHPILSIFLQHFISKTSILHSRSFITVHV